MNPQNIVLQGARLINDKYMLRSGLIRPELELTLDDSKKFAGLLSEYKVHKILFKVTLEPIGVEDEPQPNTNI